MKALFKEILESAKSYLETRKNNIHVKVSVNFAYKLMEREGGEEDIVIPAIILHDVGWKEVPEDLQLKAFGPNVTLPEFKRKHEVEGAKIARNILERHFYDEDKIEEIVDIIEGHDSRKEPVSLNDMIVKDADKLWRFTKEGFKTDIERFEETIYEYYIRIQAYLDKWFFTDSAKDFAAKEMANRLKEMNGKI